MTISITDLLHQYRKQSDPELPGVILSSVHAQLAEASGTALTDRQLRDFLQLAASSRFLRALSREQRYGPLERCVNAALLRTGYSLNDLLHDRERSLSGRCFLQEGDGQQRSLSFAQARMRTAAIAHALLADPSVTDSLPPRVAMLTANSLESALCDLACLAHGIFITPLSVHLDEQSAGEIFRRLNITVVLTDSHERQRFLLKLRHTQKLNFTILASGVDDPAEKSIERFEAYVARNRERELPEGGLAARRTPAAYRDTATIMFTSGSTGSPKGVGFSMMNMMSKRFARAAALPEVGIDETLVAYLPLFHTFGRFLELQGMLFWGGRYVFAGNPSREALFARMQEFRPTGLISIPQRWAELREEAMRDQDAKRGLYAAAGGRLRWGLSAAGYLAPQVFRFFHEQDVALCSGFGMTEATGGILMTPPGEYLDDSVGIPLPGIDVRLSSNGELEMRGPYVAHTFANEGPLEKTTSQLEETTSQLETTVADTASVQVEEVTEWQSTGDLFEELAEGHFRIIDRVKDIYKNSRGQTIAPLGVESRFRDVPGLRRCFLAGDGRSHNTLLIVVDDDAPVMRSMSGERQRENYFNEIVRTVNAGLAPYERIIEFAILKRDFQQSEGELTPKGSLNRKRIAENFHTEIEALYRSRRLTFRIAGLQLHLPLWMLRDIGCTERDLRIQQGGIYNAAEQRLLQVAPGRNPQSWRIGDLEYELQGTGLDLGRLCRQPEGWTGNAALADFLPCHEGWDVELDGVVDIRPLRMQNLHGVGAGNQAPAQAHPLESDEGNRGNVGTLLLQLHRLLVVIFAADSPATLQLFDDIAAAMQGIPYRHAALLRRRLGSCAWHDDESVRIRAYTTLLLFDPDPDDPAPYNNFIESGRTFLDDPALERIVTLDLRGERLIALRRRLQVYREKAVNPSAEELRVFRHLLELLYRLAARDASYVYEVRAEFAQWMLLPGMLPHAQQLFYVLKEVYVRRQRALSPDEPALRRIVESAVFTDDTIGTAERERIVTLFSSTPFLSLTVLMLYGVQGLRCDQLAAGSLRVEPAAAPDGSASHFRVTIQATGGARYSFLLILDDGFIGLESREPLLALLRIAGAPVRLPALPRFGSFMPEQGAISLGEVPGRRLSELMESRRTDADTAELRRWWVSAFAAWLRGWRDSGRTLIPGAIDAANVQVPMIRYREGAVIMSISGWVACDGVACILQALYAALRRAAEKWQDARLQSSWVCDAVYEVFGDDEAHGLLLELIDAESAELRDMLDSEAEDEAELRTNIFGESDRLAVSVIVRSVQKHSRKYCPPLAVENAVVCWREWAALYPALVEERGEDYLRHVLDLYGVLRTGQAARWYVTRHTLLAGLPPDCGARLEEVILHMHSSPSWTVTRSIELAELQESIPAGLLRECFLRMVFPSVDRAELHLVRVRQGGQDAIVLEHSMKEVQHVRVVIRETVSAAESGVILSLMLRERFPVPVGEDIRYLALIDSQQRIAGGLLYTSPQEDEAELKAIIVEEALRGQGFGKSLLDDLALRMKAAGAQSLRAPHFLLPFCKHAGFEPDPRDGELRRVL